jgi:voltage-gated potassium channel
MMPSPNFTPCWKMVPAPPLNTFAAPPDVRASTGEAYDDSNVSVADTDLLMSKNPHRKAVKEFEMDLMLRLAMLSSKLDGLKQCVNVCHEGILDIKHRRKGKHKKKDRKQGDLSPKKASPRFDSDFNVNGGDWESEVTSRMDQNGVDADQNSNGCPNEATGEWERQTSKQNASEHPSEPGSHVSPIRNTNKLKSEVEQVMNNPDHNFASKVYAIGMPLFVFASVIWTLVQTVDGDPINELLAAAVEIIAEGIFAVDLMLRFYICQFKLRFLCDAHNVADVFVVVPLIMRLSFGCVLSAEQKDTVVGSALFLVTPLLRLMKTMRGLKSFNLIVTNVLRVYVETWPTMLVLVYVCLSFATLIYYTEPRENIANYPQAIWFVIVTVSTVGYGDVTPVTPAGYVVASLMVCSTMFIMALPLGIIGAEVSDIWKDRHTILLRAWVRETLAYQGYDAADFPRFFESFDSDGSGELDYYEFCAMLTEMQVDIRPEKMREFFDSFDEDHSGAVDTQEFLLKLYPDPVMRRGLDLGPPVSKIQRMNSLEQSLFATKKSYTHEQVMAMLAEAAAPSVGTHKASAVSSSEPRASVRSIASTISENTLEHESTTSHSEW